MDAGDTDPAADRCGCHRRPPDLRGSPTSRSIRGCGCSSPTSSAVRPAAARRPAGQRRRPPTGDAAEVIARPCRDSRRLWSWPRHPRHPAGPGHRLVSQRGLPRRRLGFAGVRPSRRRVHGVAADRRVRPVRVASAAVVVVEQSALHYQLASPARGPERHTAVAVLFERSAGGNHTWYGTRRRVTTTGRGAASPTTWPRCPPAGRRRDLVAGRAA